MFDKEILAPQSMDWRYGLLMMVSGAILLSVAPGSAVAKGEYRYAQVYTQTSSHRAVVVGKKWSDFLKEWRALEKKRFRLFDHQRTHDLDDKKERKIHKDK